jgi:hypothetical protein
MSINVDSGAARGSLTSQRKFPASAIKTFGAGSKAKSEAQAYAEEIAPQARSGKYWERRTATFADLWDKFATHELSSPALRPSTPRVS